MLLSNDLDIQKVIIPHLYALGTKSATCPLIKTKYSRPNHSLENIKYWSELLKFTGFKVTFPYFCVHN